METELKLKWRRIPLSEEFVRESEETGTHELVAVVGIVHDGEMRVIMAREQLLPTKSYFHASASIGKPGEKGPFRRPTDEEMAAVRGLIHGVEMIEDDDVDKALTTDPTGNLLRHLWSRYPVQAAVYMTSESS